METLLVYPQNSKELKTIMKVLNVKFESKATPYNPEFVAKIKRSDEQFEKGEVQAINMEDLWK